jgi:hypothetical protein
MILQAPYSPDMASCDFWLFPKLKVPLKGKRFESREDIDNPPSAHNTYTIID